MPERQVTPRRILRVNAEGASPLDDHVVVERALEMRVGGQSLAVTLRTPGRDRELTLGFLASEGVIREPVDVLMLTEQPSACADEPDHVEVTLAPGTQLDWTRFERNFASSSACGLCGRAHLDSLRAGLVPLTLDSRVDPLALLEWPALLREAQQAFALTGGIHAAAFAMSAGAPELLREDVGRHNAVDKVIGALFEQNRFPPGGGVLWVSGRTGAEIVLKAARAGIPVLASVGAPSSLAIELAEVAHMTLVGFLREGRMNVYCGEERLAGC